MHIPNLNQLILFRHLAEDPLMQQAADLLQASVARDDQLVSVHYAALMHGLLEQAEQHGQPLWSGLVLTRLAEEETPFSLRAEGRPQEIEPLLLRSAIHDIPIIQAWMNLDWRELLTTSGLEAESMYEALIRPSALLPALTANLASLAEIFQAGRQPRDAAMLLWQHYAHYSCGPMALYHAFQWNDGGLQGIAEPDPIGLDELVGCDDQVRILCANTDAFLAGKPAQHVLLSGARGTGKSSSIKGLLNQYASKSLRMVELRREQLPEYPRLVNLLRSRQLHFIIFVDDLSFETFEGEYKSLKSSIEGSLQSPPGNIMLCVSSNLRHLIAQEELTGRRDPHRSDRQQEQLSFASRFGISLSYYTPTPAEYLAIVDHLAKRFDIALAPEELHRQAMQWELNHHGRSGRSARQFIEQLI